MNLIPTARITSDALNAEQLRMDLIAQNIANANTTKDANGDIYRRKMVLFESYINEEGRTGQGGPELESIRVRGIHEDSRPGDQVYDPNHPHADERGMVTLSNVKLAREMVDLISATRSYQANLSVIKTSRQMAMQALQIGK